MNIGICSSCSLEILWCVTENGKRIPINPEAVEYGGNITIREGLVHVLAKGEISEAGEKRYRSHFATCKTVASHRKPKLKEDRKQAAKPQKEPPPQLFES